MQGFHGAELVYALHTLKIVIRSQVCRLRPLVSPSTGTGPINASTAKRKPILNIKLKAIILHMRMPSSVNSQVLHPKRKAEPPMVEMAL